MNKRGGCMGKGILITGTSTEVGKTYITALLIKAMRHYGLNCGYYKAAQGGAVWQGDQLIPSDVAFVCAMTGLKGDLEEFISYTYEAPVAPHVAANIASRQIEMEKIVADYSRLQEKYSYICVEGSGGIACPLRIDGRQTIMLADMICQLALPIIIVTSVTADTFNNLLLTIEFARSKQMVIKGIILNHYDEDSPFSQDKRRQIEELIEIPILCTVSNAAEELVMTKGELLQLFE